MADFWRIPHAMHRFKILLQKIISTSLLSVENTWCFMNEPLIPLLEAMAVPPETIQNIRNHWSKINIVHAVVLV
ncbi:unnamed protein product [Ixodes persulcatus]